MKGDTSDPTDTFLVRFNETPAENSLRLGFKGLVAGALFSGFKLQHMVQTHTVLELVGKCLGSYAVPIGLSAGIFGAVTSLMDEMRGKDKLFTNAAIGGFAAGVFYGSRANQPWKAFQMGCMFAVAGVSMRMIVTDAIKVKKKTEAEVLIYDTVYLGKMDHLRPKA